MPNRVRLSFAALAAIALLGAAAPAAAAESAQQILETAMERYEQRLASIDSVTVVQEVLGMESTTRLEKKMIEDRPVLIPTSAGRGGDAGTMYRQLDHMAKSATLRGTEAVDGHPCWAVHVAELGGMSVAAEGADDFQARDGTLYIDKSAYVLRRMQMNGEMTRNGQKSPVTLDLQLKDYREVDGWLHPFRTEMRLGGAGGGEPPEVAEMRKAMAEMKEELAKMPPEQRQMVEQMMKGRMPRLEEGVEDGKVSIAVTVKEIRVNEPAP